MRLFVGIELDEAIKNEAERVATVVRRRLGTVTAKWVPAANVHLTVRFIGHVPDDRVERLLAALDRQLDADPFDVELGGGGRFPPRGAPRVLWIGLARGLPALAMLREEFDRRLLPLGYAGEGRPFSAHLTLARFKDARGSDGRRVDEALSHVAINALSQHVERVTVFESRLSPKGPQYFPVRRLPLVGVPAK